MNLNRRRLFPILLLSAVLPVAVSFSVVRAESEHFPVPAVIKPNVAFWTKIYTEYPSDQGVLHDSRRLDIIYGVIELVDPDRHGGRKTNRARIKKAKKKYKAILAKLMRGETPVGPIEQRVAGLFGPETKPPEFRAAMRNIRCQTGQKDRFRDGVNRSGAYIDEIKRIFRNIGLPADLAYLPHVESSFNPKAYSKFGAAGMWQFTRTTGRYYMKVDYTIDERRDPIISSHAAAKLLRFNYRKLQSWPMALTAYNHGVAGMLRARRKKGSYERIFSEYRSRIFKFASRNFYSEFLAAREAARNYRQYFGDLTLDKPVESREILLKGYVSLPQMARQLDLDIAALRALNPALRPPVFRDQKYVPKGYRLKLPDLNDADWQMLAADFGERFYKRYQKKSRIYTVQRGDTAGEIAKIHDVKLADLIAANNLNSRATIYVNQNLRIPLLVDKPVKVAKNESGVNPPPPSKGSVSASFETSASADQRTGKLVSSFFVENPVVDFPPAGETQAQPPLQIAAGRPADVQAAQGEAASQSVSANTADNAAVARLADTRKSEQTGLAGGAGFKPPGQPKTEPVLSRKHEILSAKPAADSPQNVPEIALEHLVVDRIWSQNGKQVGIIQVEIEETLGHYAEWLKVTTNEIRRLNGLSYGQPLHLHQKIRIPLHRVDQHEFVEKRFEYHQELAEDFFASYHVEKVFTYSIKRGDNIWTLSHQEFEVPLWLIKRLNTGVDFSALRPSQKLVIPVIVKFDVQGSTRFYDEAYL